MLDHAQEVLGYVADLSYAGYLASRTRQLIVERVLQIVGEAANRVSGVTRAAHPEIAWRAIIAQRNVLAHEYGDIKHDEIWKTVTIDVPVLIRQLEALVPPAPGAQRHGWGDES